MRAWTLAALLLAPALAGCVGVGSEELDPAASPPSQPGPLEADPTAPGEHEVAREPFDFGYVLVEDPAPGQAYPVRVNGTAYLPAEAEGPHPLVVFMHGRHTTCRVGPDGGLTEQGRAPRTFGTHVCPDAEPVAGPVDSWNGYGYVAETLASRGYVVASVNANDVNDRDIASRDDGADARAQVLLATIDGFQRLDEGEDPYQPAPARDTPLRDTSLDEQLEGRVDEDRVGLVGHSRGGEGVARAVEYDREVHDGAHGIDAVFAIAPIDSTDPMPRDVDLAVLLPYCDGDVYSLSGAELFDRRRLHEGEGFTLQALALGANHNFYNSVWAEHSDDASWMTDPHCGALRGDGGGRLSPTDQQRHGAALITAFLETSLDDEEAYRDWWATPTGPPASACPADVDRCPGQLHLTYAPPPEDRRLVEDAADEDALRENDLGGTATARGFETAQVCRPEACPGWNVQGAPSLTLTWDGEATYRLELPDDARDASAFDTLAVRLGVNHGHPANTWNASQDLTVRLEDATGQAAGLPASSLGSALFYPPGSARDPDGSTVPLSGFGDDNAKVTLNQVHAPLDAFADRGVDLTQVAAVELAFDRTETGSVQVNDVLLAR